MLVPTLASLLGDLEPVIGDPGDVIRHSGAKAGNRAGAAAGEVRASATGATPEPPGGVKQKARQPIVPGDAVTRELGPVAKCSDTSAGCLGARSKGPDPSAKSQGIGVVDDSLPLPSVLGTPVVAILAAAMLAAARGTPAVATLAVARPSAVNASSCDPGSGAGHSGSGIAGSSNAGNSAGYSMGTPCTHFANLGHSLNALDLDKEEEEEEEEESDEESQQEISLHSSEVPGLSVEQLGEPPSKLARTDIRAIYTQAAQIN
ncbi:UNVERIFIED_CONTAM: hypothetical protein FKN15_066775 [Acipenser sinensis]